MLSELRYCIHAYSKGAFNFLQNGSYGSALYKAEKAKEAHERLGQKEKAKRLEEKLIRPIQEKIDEELEQITRNLGIELTPENKELIARALLSNPDILIFDEATSSLDSESEKLIQKAIFSIAGQKTMIFIAHRLSTIEHADEIIVIGKKRILEKGNYKELIKKRGYFAKMVYIQRMRN